VPEMIDSVKPNQDGRLKLVTAPQAAAQAIRESIIAGELRSGDRIVEQKWATRLGIGQPTLREALHELEHQGLLYKQPQRGTYVATLDSEDYRLIQEVRIPLEAIAVGKAATNFSREADQELTNFVSEMAGGGLNDMDVRAFHDCDVSFHRKIWELAGNKYLKDALEAISFRLFVFSIVGRWPGNPGAAGERLSAAQQHLRILEGIRTRDPVVARQVFVHETVQYWNTQYGLAISEDEMQAAGSPSTLQAFSPAKPSAATVRGR
jgi:DNA-binding GntR family transcriptional regulator